MSDSLPDLRKEALVDSLIQMIRSRRVSDVISVIDSHEDPTANATSSYALMARGYIALALKADPQRRTEGMNMLSEILARLRAEGSQDAIFFADQLATADRVLLEK
jgi:hypothetical protein